MFRKIKINKILLGIFLLALLLRLFGIWHGWPFIYNVDEPALVRSAVGIRFNPNPAHFDWPHLHFYLSFGVLAFFYLVRGFFQVVGLQPFLLRVIPFFWEDPAVYYLIVRIFNAFLGALTVVPVYLTGKVLFNSDKRFRGVRFSELAAILSALAFAVIPFHVKDSHLAIIDVPMVFWLAWSVYFAARILRGRRSPGSSPEALPRRQAGLAEGEDLCEGGWRNYIFAGIFAGLAASTKYNGIMVLLVVALAYFLLLPKWGAGKEKNQALRPFRKPGFGELPALLRGVFSPKLFVSALTALLVFFLGTPYAILDWDTFWSYEYPKGVLWQFENVGSVANFAEYFANFKRLVWTEFLPADLSWPFYLIFLFTIVEFVYLFFRFVVADFSPRSKKAGTSPATTNCSGDPCGRLGKVRALKRATTIRLTTLAFLLIFPIFYCLFVVRGKKFDSHYFLPAFPFFALIVGKKVTDALFILSEKVSSNLKFGLESSKQNIKPKLETLKDSELVFKAFHIFFVFLIFFPALGKSVHTGLVYARQDTRTQASQWIDNNVEPGTWVAVTGTEDIEIVAKGVERKTYKKLSILDKFEQYDFIIVTDEKRVYTMEKMADNGFELVQEYTNVNPTRRGPHVWIFLRSNSE